LRCSGRRQNNQEEGLVENAKCCEQLGCLNDLKASTRYG
jgi:hypothetical protein